MILCPVTYILRLIRDDRLLKLWFCLNAVEDESEKQKAAVMVQWAADLIQIVSKKDEPTFSGRLCSPITWFLWGQALIKIARNYLLPVGPEKESKSAHEHHLALYSHCLDLAATKFEKCSRLVAQLARNTRSSSESAILIRTKAECHAAMGHIMLSKAREASLQVLRTRLLSEAKQYLRQAHHLDARSPCLYNLACVASLANLPVECRGYLKLAQRSSALPPLIHVFHDPDLNNVRSERWFASFMEVVPTDKPSTDNSWLFSFDVGIALLESTFAMPEPSNQADVLPHAMLHIPKPAEAPVPTHYTRTADVPPPTTTAPVSSPSKLGGAKFDGLTESMYFDEGLNKLQASLTRDGFSRSTVVSMLTEVHKQKKADKAQNERFEAAHARLMMRLEAAGMKQKSVIPGDGNCQFHSISDQLFDGIEQSPWVRAQIVQWLREHGDWELPENGARLRDFALEDWDSYCNNMARPGIWGDHLTLTAAANLFGVRIVLFSSVEDNHYITEYLPSVITSPTVLYLCHYAEYHYGSVCKKDAAAEEAIRQADALAESVAQQQ